MNAIFEIKEDGSVGILMLDDCTCGEIEEAQEDITELLEDWLYDRDLDVENFDIFKGKLIYMDDINDFSVMREWDGFDGNSCGIFYNSNFFSKSFISCTSLGFSNCTLPSSSFKKIIFLPLLVDV